MKIKSKKPKGQRIFKSKHPIPIWVESVGKGWWFDLKNGDWVKNPTDFGKTPYITSL